MQDFFFIKLDKKNVRVNFQDILYLQALENYVRIFTRQRSYTLLITFGRIEKLLPAGSFCRVHRSYIVSISHITAFDTENVYIDDSVIPIGDKFRRALSRRVVVVHTNPRKQLNKFIDLNRIESQN